MSTGFKTAQVAAGDVPATLTDFVTYVDLKRMNGGVSLSAADADSIRVYSSSAKTTEWAREIVSVDEMHVKVAGANFTSTVSIFVDWDGVRADYAVTDTYGRNAVWTGYRGVYHLNDLVDSTGNGYTLTNTNSVAFNAALMGNGGDSGTPNTNKTLRYTVTGNPYTIASNSAFSMTAWIKARSEITSSPAFRKPLSLSIRTNFVYYQLLELWDGGTPTITFGRTRYGTAEANVTVTHTMSTTDFAKYDMTYDGSLLAGYINGSSQGTVTGTGNGSTWSANQSGLGIFSTVVDNNGWSPAIMDEVRISTATLSGDWLTTEYNNQDDEAGFWGTWSDVGAVDTTKFFVMMQ